MKAQSIVWLMDAIDIGYTLTDDLEVIVVDDGSVDGSRRILELLADRYKAFRLVRHEKSRGYGAALRSGFSAATKEWVFYTDGDGQYDVNDLTDLATQMDGVDVVNGHKIRRVDGWRRRSIGALYAWGVNGLFNLPIRDIDCDFRLIRTRLIKDLDLKLDSGSICVELVMGLADAGARFREVPVPHYARQFGKSEFFQFTRIVRTLIQVMRLYLGRKR